MRSRMKHSHRRSAQGCLIGALVRLFRSFHHCASRWTATESHRTNQFSANAPDQIKLRKTTQHKQFFFIQPDATSTTTIVRLSTLQTGFSSSLLMLCFYAIFSLLRWPANEAEENLSKRFPHRLQPFLGKVYFLWENFCLRRDKSATDWDRLATE